MKVVLRFDLDNDCDNLLYKQMQCAESMAYVISELKSDLRSIVKYGREGMHTETAQKILESLYEKLNEESIDINDIS